MAGQPIITILVRSYLDGAAARTRHIDRLYTPVLAMLHVKLHHLALLQAPEALAVDVALRSAGGMGVHGLKGPWQGSNRAVEKGRWGKDAPLCPARALHAAAPSDPAVSTAADRTAPSRTSCGQIGRSMGLQHCTRMLHLVNKEIVAAFLATDESKALQAGRAQGQGQLAMTLVHHRWLVCSDRRTLTTLNHLTFPVRRVLLPSWPWP